MRYTPQRKYIESARGFTVMEMLVALAIFSVVMIVAISALVTLVDANRKARSQSLVIDNVNAALEVMSRSLREGSNYYVPSPDVISFIDKDGLQAGYELDGGRIVKVLPDSTKITMTAPTVVVEKLDFEIIGTNSDLSDDHPKVLIIARGKVTFSDKTASDFNVQTTVAQRFKQVTQWTTAGGQTGGGAVAGCSFADQAGRVIVPMRLSGGSPELIPALCPYNDTYCSTDLGMFAVSPWLESGYYDISLEAHGGAMCGCAGCLQQDNEEYYIEIYGDNGATLLGTTSATSDLPGNYVNTDTFMVETNMFLSDEVTHIKPVHTRNYADPGACNDDLPARPENGVIPLCVAFDWNGTISTTTIDKEEI